MTANAPIRVIFVCMGNICRSPLAEAIFRHKVDEQSLTHRFELDSAGTGGWHEGADPDPRVREIAARFGVVVEGSARRITVADLARFDHLICMDEDNRQSLLELGADPAKVRLLLDADPNATMREVPDPYYGRRDGFEAIFDLIEPACEALLGDLADAPT